MRYLAAAFVAAICLAAVPAAAGELRVIELTDGSVITGEIVSFANGSYTISSGSIGTVTIQESRVRSIRQQGGAGTAPAQDPSAELRAVQERMMRDPEIMTRIQSLQGDPEFQRLLQDPEIMRAVQAGDLSTLTSNPDFMRLLQNSTVQDITRKVVR